jgi:hypothetical protein
MECEGMGTPASCSSTGFHGVPCRHQMQVCAVPIRSQAVPCSDVQIHYVPSSSLLSRAPRALQSCTAAAPNAPCCSPVLAPFTLPVLNSAARVGIVGGNFDRGRRREDGTDLAEAEVGRECARDGMGWTVLEWEALPMEVHAVSGSSMPPYAVPCRRFAVTCRPMLSDADPCPFMPPHAAP